MPGNHLAADPGSMDNGLKLGAYAIDYGIVLIVVAE